MTDRNIQRTNPYSGQSEMLTTEESKIYDKVKQDEIDENYTDMQKGLDKFSRLNPKAYMTLLDQQLASRRALRALRGGFPFNSGNHFHPGICILLP